METNSPRLSLSPAPLQTLGINSLKATDIQGLDRVVLRQLMFAAQDGPASRLEYTSDDLTESFEATAFREHLASDDVLSWTLRFFFDSPAHTVDVHFDAAEPLDLPTGADASIIQAFLNCRGFTRQRPA